ncbi:glycosyltransferase family 4 protein [Aminivibrio sp.]|jgi:glycosyltransferase involved in cell wall biosynthesis|uniref:glycosyltransferase family 4 protein n=1 Tax=Aminivibrio sp. TaxID=1872489 RepID=UPI001A45616F|nr:glycosyltransferase family 4 protein [Aminivibrio sp.]MBL3539040.1 glycosyltransferase family 4 protein [Aminivibrio sp.]
MKILHLLSQRPDSTGSGTTLQAILMESEKSGHENMVVAGIQEGALPFFPGLSNLRTRFVTFGGGDLPFPMPGMSDVMPYPAMRFSDLTDRQLSSYNDAFKTAVLESVDRFRPDIIHSNHLWLATSLARRSLPGIPMVATCHGTDLRQMRTCPGFRPDVVSGCSGLDGVFALYSGQVEEIRQVYGIPAERIHVTGAGFRSELFVPGEKTADIPTIVYGGKLSRAKGVPWMLRAFASVTDLPWTLLLAGGGTDPERAECIELAGRLGKRAIIAGPLKQEEFAAALSGANIFILPSLYEGLPLVLPEALASGCLCLATDLPGVRDILKIAGKDWLRLIPCPPLEGVDTIAPGYESKFVSDIAANLRKVLTDLVAGTLSAESYRELAERLKNITWQAVFQRMEKVYYTLATVKSR